MAKINTLFYSGENDKDKQVIKLANELAGLERRSPHDSIRILLEDEGQKKINRLKEEKETKDG